MGYLLEVFGSNLIENRTFFLDGLWKALGFLGGLLGGSMFQIHCKNISKRGWFNFSFHKTSSFGLLLERHSARLG